MNELVKIEVKDGQQLVSGRELHEFLEVGTPYDKWFPRMCEYGFSDGKDFSTFLSESTGGRPATNHWLTIPMAKEISMLQRTEKGKQARQYFIKCEEAWNSPEMILARANQIQSRMIEQHTEKIKMLETKIKEDEPKVEFYNEVIDSKNTCDMQTVAKLLNFKKVGRNTLFEILRNEGILQKDNIPYQKYVDKGWFRVLEMKYNDARTGDVRIDFKTVVYQRGVEAISHLLKSLHYPQNEVVKTGSKKI